MLVVTDRSDCLCFIMQILVFVFQIEKTVISTRFLPYRFCLVAYTVQKVQQYFCCLHCRKIFLFSYCKIRSCQGKEKHSESEVLLYLCRACTYSFYKLINIWRPIVYFCQCVFVSHAVECHHTPSLIGKLLREECKKASLDACE